MTDQIATITIRRLDIEDEGALARLAQRDSTPVPEGRLLGAEVEGRLLAAISLDGGGLIADPFSGTTELRSLLELRAAQLRRRHEARRHTPVRARRRSHGALAGSPPGAGGRLVSLLRT